MKRIPALLSSLLLFWLLPAGAFADAILPGEIYNGPVRPDSGIPAIWIAVAVIVLTAAAVLICILLKKRGNRKD